MSRKKKNTNTTQKGTTPAEAKTNRGGAKTAARPKAGAGKAKNTAKADNVSIGDRIGQFKEFFESSKVEIKKVTWPTQKETLQTGVAVLVIVVVLAAFLGLVDMGLSKLIEIILA